MKFENRPAKQFNIYEWLEAVEKRIQKDEMAFPYTSEILRATTEANLKVLKEGSQRERLRRKSSLV
jgi:hypothetical protein